MLGWSCDCHRYLSTLKSAAVCCQKGRPRETEGVCSQHQWLNELQWDVQTVASSSRRCTLSVSRCGYCVQLNVNYVNVSPESQLGIQEWRPVQETEAFHCSTPKLSLPSGFQVYV